MVERIINRLKEPSTYAGLAAISLASGLSMDKFQLYANAAAGLFGFVSIIIKEVGSAK